ncbi:MAG: aldo/keto reductase [Eggerthellaceae bacterium]|nr:aldo/keto reductase [Eggerthellaceae bacterium]
MRQQLLGRGLSVSAVGLGCMGLSHAYGQPVDEAEAVSLIREAADLGCTFFDTAECYGTPDAPHDNEVLVGKALAPIRDQVVIGTKFGLSFDLGDGKVNHDLVPDARPEVIRRSLEGSLLRLGTDHVDLYYQHRQDPAVPVEVVAEVMADLIREGKVLHWGLSEVGEDVIRRAHAACPVTAVQNRYSMMARWYEGLFPVLEELGIGLVAFSPLANGLLSGAYGDQSSFATDGSDYRTVMPQFAPEALRENQGLLDLVGDVARDHGATPAQVSLAWMMCKKPWIVPIPGTRRPDRLRENLGAAAVELSADEVTALDEALESVGMSAVFGGSAVKAAS